MCLTPLPKSSAEITELPRATEEVIKGGSKALKGNQDLNDAFRDYDIPILGEMS